MFTPRKIISLLLVLLFAIGVVPSVCAEDNIVIPSGQDVHLEEIQKKVEEIQSTPSDDGLLKGELINSSDSIESGNTNRGPIVHECHTGPKCEYCDLYCVITVDCGCKVNQYQCCCGKVMRLRNKDYINRCDKH